MTAMFDTLSDLDHKQVDQLCSNLEKDDQINLEVLIGEQMNAFWLLQPAVSSIQESPVKDGTFLQIGE